ncbi:NAD(P)-binding protein [Streptomyces sp. M19]
MLDSVRSVKRRSVITNGIRGIASLALLNAGAIPAIAANRTKDDAPGKRLAIVGGGAAGIAAAYFCDSGWSVDLFESRDKIGGHADTVGVTDQAGSTRWTSAPSSSTQHPSLVLVVP